MADVERAFAGTEIAAMQRHQAEFMDLERCSFFFTSRTRPSTAVSPEELPAPPSRGGSS